ncbi:MAG: TIGR00297 family protein [Haloarculaceae archaeon]
MTSTVRRAGGFALVGTLSLSVPYIASATRTAVSTVAAPAPYIVVAALALYVVDRGPLFELFARPGDRRDGRLYGLAGFALAAAALALLAVRFGLPMPVYVGTVVLLSWGNLGGHAVRAVRDEPIVATAGFVAAGFVAGAAGHYAAAAAVGSSLEWPLVAFLAASGALLGALLRAVLFERDDPLVMVSVGLLLWLFFDLPLTITTTRIAIALVVTVAFGYVSYALETASLPGMLTGVLLGLLTIVLGGNGWFVVLITFFGVGGLSTKFRYDAKLERGIAEENEGARGSGNVLANSMAGLAAVLGAAASPSLTDLPAELFLFAFAGSIAAAMSDTLSSEIGGVFDGPRLITTFERVEPGTDGAVTWQGELAGLLGAGLIAGIGYGMFDISAVGAGVILAAGVVGMTVDSLLGATAEGWLLENEGVNFAATVAAAVAAGLLAVGAGIVSV